jgi:hypothetical protein
MDFNRNWLKAQIASYLKDESVAANLDVWIDLAAKRISQVLECFEMETLQGNSLRFSAEDGLDGGFADGTNLIIIDGGDAYNQDPSAAPTEWIQLPARFRRLVAVQAYDNGVWRNLRSVPKHEASAYKRSGVPLVYLIEDSRIYPLPFAEADYRAIYLREVEIPIGDNPDDVLTAYPMIFLNAALAEAYDWKQDNEMNMRYEQKWQQEAMQVTAIYRSEHTGETPAMRAV